MKVTRLVLHNFGSFHGAHQIAMNDLGLVFVSGQNLDEPKAKSNGAGKSTIFDALDWCLFGEVPKGDTAKSIVNEEAGKDCWVIAELIDENMACIVYRYRQRKEGSGLRFYVLPIGGKWMNATALDEAQTQKAINSELGLDRTIFRAAVYRAQGDTTSFADATDGERKELLTALIPELQEVDELRDVAKAKLVEQQTARAQLQGSIQQAEQELAGINAMDYDAAEAKWKADHAHQVAGGEAALKTAQDNLSAAEVQISVLEARRAQLQQLAHQPPQPAVVWHVEYEQRLAAAQPLHTRVEVARERYKALVAELGPLLKGEIKEGPCSRCKQPVSSAHLQQEIQKMSAEAALILHEGKEARAALDTQEAKVKEAHAHRAAEFTANGAAEAQRGQQIGALKAEIFSLEQVQKNIPSLASSVTGWKTWLHGAQILVWPGAAWKQEAMARKQVLSAQLAFAHAGIAEREKKEKLFTFWIDALTAKGLKNLIMDSRIEEMTKAANEWVQELTGGTTWVRFETQTMTAGGKLTEKLNVRIFRHNPDGTITERNFKSWSGGEKTRVALGVDQGLSTLIADRATKSWDLLIADESFRQHLDSGGREAIFDLLTKLNRGTIFVVDHDHEMAASFEKHITVRVENRRSTLWEPLSGKQITLSADPIPAAYLPIFTEPDDGIGKPYLLPAAGMVV